MAASLILFNTVLFAALGGYAMTQSTRTDVRSVRLFWRLAALPFLAVVVGGLQRLAFQSIRLGLVPDDNFSVLLGGWQVVQSMLVAAVGVLSFLTVRRLATRFSDSEHLLGDAIDRTRKVDVETLGLTRREAEVLEVIAVADQIDDRTIASALHISPATAHSHVSALLRKTELSDRRDLRILGLLITKGHK